MKCYRRCNRLTKSSILVTCYMPELSLLISKTNSYYPRLCYRHQFVFTTDFLLYTVRESQRKKSNKGIWKKKINAPKVERERCKGVYEGRWLISTFWNLRVPLTKAIVKEIQLIEGTEKSKLLLHGLTFLQMRYIALGLWALHYIIWYMGFTCGHLHLNLVK